MGNHSGSIEKRYVEIWLQVSGLRGHPPHDYYENWNWLVSWEGWFSEHGVAEGKQAAADKATEKWWTWVQTELPRNLELEVAMIVARTPVRPLPNSLLGEDTEFLRKVQWWLNEVYKTASKPDEAPRPATDLMARLSEELHRRRLTEPQPEQPAGPAVSGGYRRRRR
ncbi:hypothetical protein [Devosia sp. Root635]|uniref:hypothetical protein n=1 Tax=Devosia sp. Root635 TaxID=1736575 RepID=UPI0006F50551|nr:hypothetical protein [Devosia sp. Root635]KRA44716.1 hypothetical protein ASD80_06120 [Devosia sp. Root635]